MSARRYLLLGVLFLSLLVAVFTSCRSPALRRQYDEGASEGVLTCGPIRMGALGLSTMTASAHLPHRLEEQIEDLSPPEFVMVEFSYGTFDFVIFVADGERFSFRRALFEEYSIRVKARIFGRIARARRLAVLFDDDKEGYVLTQDELDLLRRFAAELGLAHED